MFSVTVPCFHLCFEFQFHSFASVLHFLFQCCVQFFVLGLSSVYLFYFLILCLGSVFSITILCSALQFWALCFSSVFCKNGDILKENDTITFLKLADTYQQIAEKGADAFYNGTIAENLIRDIRNAGEFLSVKICHRKPLIFPLICHPFAF